MQNMYIVQTNYSENGGILPPFTSFLAILPAGLWEIAPMEEFIVHTLLGST